MALLRISEAIAERARIVRYSRTDSTPRELITICVSGMTESNRLVSFTDDELMVIGVNPTYLDPFVFEEEHADLLMSQSIGHTALERRPLIRCSGQTTVVLPTAIGVACRRFAIERAALANELGVFQSAFHGEQYREIFLLGCAAWEIKFIEALKSDPSDDFREFVGTFDDGGYVHLLFTPDDFEEVIQTGLVSKHELNDSIRERINYRAGRLAEQSDFRRGLTILVHGGIGRELLPLWGDFPSGWHQLYLSAPEFMFLGSESEFTAMRAWKILQQVDDLEEKGVVFPNLRGFFNLTAFAYHADFELVPTNMSPGIIYLHTDVMLPLRHRVRNALDLHAAIAPNGEGWISVQRETTGGFLGETRERPVFISPGAMAQRELRACVETPLRPWWVHCSKLPESAWHRGIAFHILELTLGWLAQLAFLFEERFSAMHTKPVTYRFRFPDIETITHDNLPTLESPLAPEVVCNDEHIAIDCTPRYLGSFLNPGNLGDRLMIASLVRGAYLFMGNSKLPDDKVEELVQTVADSDNARYFQFTLGQTPQDIIYDRTELPQLRLLMPEDFAWSRLNLVRRAGYKRAPGSIPACQARAILAKAVDSVWERIRSRLIDLSRESVIERALLNFVAVQKEHRDWLRTSAAKLALYDSSEVLAVANERAFRRDSAGLACRIIAEMAQCTSQYGVGSLCAKSDLDFFIAEVVALLECANYSDALRFGLATGTPTMEPNGSFGFDPNTGQTVITLLIENRTRMFLEAAADQAIELEGENERDVADSTFESAFIAEFGLTEEEYQQFVLRVTLEALENKTAHLRLRRTEVVYQLREVGAVDPERVFNALTLRPRIRWDENNPVKANKRDWYPWRYNRRLSILRRPLVQLSTDADPVVLVIPSLLAGWLDNVEQAAYGRLPEELFESSEMAACIGRAADRNGHEFNRKVAKRFCELKWNTSKELKLTRLGGAADLGDIDVLAWRRESGLIYVVECKSLRFDRTCGEIGERLAEYALGTVDGKRTPLQKHLDRFSFVQANREQLTLLTHIPIERIELRSALVTEKLVPMQYSGEAHEILDLVTDYQLLEQDLANQ